MSQAGMAEADKQGLHGADKDNYVKDYVADNYSQYYQQEYRNSANETMKESSGSAQAGRDKDYNQQNGLYSQPGTYTAPDNYRSLSAQENAHIRSQQGEGQLASDKFEYGQVPQQTTSVSSSGEPETIVREVKVQAPPRVSADTSSSEIQPSQGMAQQSSTSPSTMPPVKGETRSKSDMPPVGKK